MERGGSAFGEDSLVDCRCEGLLQACNLLVVGGRPLGQKLRKPAEQPELKDNALKTRATAMVAQKIMSSMAKDWSASVPKAADAIDVTVSDCWDILEGAISSEV